MPRLRRASVPRPLLAVLAVTAGVLTLAACDKPTPGVTIQSGSTSTVLRPQTYCFDANPAHCRLTTSGNIGTLHTHGGGNILVDVPRTIATGFWQVRSATQKSDGTFKSLDGQGTSSPVVHDRHSTRVQVPIGSGDYYLIVTEAPLGTNKATGSWVARIVVSD